MTGHTPGPWRVVASADIPGIEADSGAICTMDADDEDYPNVHADALLIAAAPALLAVCEATADYLLEFDDHYSNLTRTMLLAVIGQAKGEAA